MNETQEKMLLQRGVMVLPDSIEHETYQDILALLLLAESAWADKPLRLFCAGQGGSAPDAMAIVDLIQVHGNVIGMLPGEAQSSHVTVWAGCAARYIYPLASIGVHCLKWSNLNTRQDRQSLRQRDEELMMGEANVARVLAEACRMEFGVSFWLNAMRDAGSDGVRIFNAATVVKMGMAKSIHRYYPQPLTPAPVVETELNTASGQHDYTPAIKPGEPYSIQE